MGITHKIYANGNVKVTGEINEIGDYEVAIPKIDSLVAHYPFVNGSGQNVIEYDYLGNGWGHLYNQYAVLTGNLAPSGCRVATDADFTTLATFLGGTGVAGGKMKKTSLEYWINPNTGADNSSVFGSIAAGVVDQTTGVNATQGLYSFFWTTTSKTTRYLSYNNQAVNKGTSAPNQRGMSVRCLLTDTSSWVEGDTVTDIDGNVYDTVQIGTQVWLASNLRVTKYNDGTPIPLVTTPASWIALTTAAYQPVVKNEETVYGALPAPDQFGFENKALDFDGVDDYVDLGFQPNLFLTSGRTLSLMFKINELIDPTLLPQVIGGSQFGIDYNYICFGTSTSFLYNPARMLEIETLTSGDQINFRFKNVLQYGEWYHLAVKVSETGVFSIYINGEDQGLQRTPINPNLWINRIGDGAGAGRPFYGCIANVKLWNTILDDDDVMQDYASFQGNIQFCENGDILCPEFNEVDTIEGKVNWCSTGFTITGEFDETI